MEGGEFDARYDPLGSPGNPSSDLTEKLTHLRLPGLKICDGQHTTPALS